MISTLKTGTTQGHDDTKGEILERISKQYGAPEEKQREAVKKLGKDEFFKIMITQIQHQDPLKPYQNEEMAAQMAQFTSLEQMMNVNANLEKLAQSQAPIHQMGATNLIGKYVTTDSSRLIHTEGKLSDLKFDLPEDAHNVRISLINDRGENIREIEAKNVKKGEAKITWDGKAGNQMPAKTGMYMIQVAAVDEHGKGIAVQTQKTERVHGVSFDGKEVVLLTGDLKSPNKMLLNKVSKIIDAANAMASAAPRPTGAPTGQSDDSDAGLVADGSPEAAGFDPNDLNEKSMPDYIPGKASKYTPITGFASADQLRQTAESAEQDQAAAANAGGQPVQSSQDGSVAGKWMK